MACNAPTSVLKRARCPLHTQPGDRGWHGVQCATV